MWLEIFLGLILILFSIQYVTSIFLPGLALCTAKLFFLEGNPIICMDKHYRYQNIAKDFGIITDSDIISHLLLATTNKVNVLELVTRAGLGFQNGC